MAETHRKPKPTREGRRPGTTWGYAFILGNGNQSVIYIYIKYGKMM
jgi:hypothetical protein